MRRIDRLLHRLQTFISYLKCELFFFFYTKIIFKNFNCKFIGLTEHMGDIVACLPIAEALRSDDNNRVIWVVNSRYADLLSEVSFIDRVLSVNCFISWSRFYQKHLGQELVDLHLHQRFCAKCDKVHIKRDFDDSINSENYYFFGTLMEAFCKHSRFPIPNLRQPHLKIAGSERARTLVHSIGGEYIVIHTSSNEKTRDLPTAEWKTLIDFLSSKFNFKIVEIGNQRTEISSAKNVISFTDLNLSLQDSAFVIKNAALFIGIDSGPAHLANALLVRGIIILGKYRNFSNYMSYTGYFEDSKNALILRSDLPLQDVKFESLKDKVKDFVEKVC